MSKVCIRDIRTIATAPSGIDVLVVKVETTEPGLYGLGCATFTQRYKAVVSAVEDYLKPMLCGRPVDAIEDIFQQTMVNSYWRNGPVLNNAISGVDEALWDIKGKMAGMPVYQLLGGKCREGVPVYRHTDGRDPVEVEDKIRALMAEGYRYLRAQQGSYGGRDQRIVKPDRAPDGAYYDPQAYARSIPKLFDHLRSHLGFEIELLHDVHERLQPIDALRLAKDLEPYRLFFLEDALAPEQTDWFRQLRSASTTPIAMGELFNNPNEWMPLIKDQLIDYIRVHVSQIGGITPAKKLANVCEAFSVKTAWHGPGDVSPVGHAANLHLDISSPAFGIQEWAGFTDNDREVFPGCPEIRNGYAYLNDRPGLGIDIDEEKAARFPCLDKIPTWTMTRWPDGTAVRP